MKKGKKAMRTKRKSLSIVKRKSPPLTSRQREVLTMLSRQEQWSIVEIAKELGVSAAAASKAVTRLELRGLVTRSDNQMDGRRIDVRLTGKAAEMSQFAALILEEGGNREMQKALPSRKETLC
jgi:DNA-binding MarR family transcriptional regulator